jgi:hypothetical protein
MISLFSKSKIFLLFNSSSSHFKLFRTLVNNFFRKNVHNRICFMKKVEEIASRTLELKRTYLCHKFKEKQPDVHCTVLLMTCACRLPPYMYTLWYTLAGVLTLKKQYLAFLNVFLVLIFIGVGGGVKLELHICPVHNKSSQEGELASSQI